MSMDRILLCFETCHLTGKIKLSSLMNDEVDVTSNHLACKKYHILLTYRICEVYCASIKYNYFFLITKVFVVERAVGIRANIRKHFRQFSF